VDDWWRDVAHTFGMLLVWLAVLSLGIACWRYGRSIDGF